MLRVDRDRLAESIEAWVYVEVGVTPPLDGPHDDSVLAEFEGFGPGKGVLVFPNSD